MPPWIDFSFYINPNDHNQITQEHQIYIQDTASKPVKPGGKG